MVMLAAMTHPQSHTPQVLAGMGSSNIIMLDNSLLPTPGSESSNFPTTLTGARAIMLLNLCSVYCMRKEYDTAHKALQQV